MGRLKHSDNPFTMGNLDDLFMAWMEDDVEYLKEWSKKAVKTHEAARTIQMKAFERLIQIKKDSEKAVDEIHNMLKDDYQKRHKNDSE